MVIEWFRSGNGVVSKKKAERCRQKVGERQEEDRREIGCSQVNNSIILRISYVYVTYILRIWYVIDSGKIKVSPYFHIKKCVDTTNIGGRTYPVRYDPVAIRLRDRNSTPHQFTKLVGDPVGRAILCIALFPQSGDSSGAILGVRSVALLHVIDSGKTREL